MHKQVAALLVRHVRRALLTRQIGAADSQPYWLTPEQHVEHAGEVQLIPTKIGDVISYAEQNHMKILGVVIVTGDGEYTDLFNRDPHVSPIDNEFLRQLFHAHAHFWFCTAPWLAERQAQA